MFGVIVIDQSHPVSDTMRHLKRSQLPCLPHLKLINGLSCPALLFGRLSFQRFLRDIARWSLGAVVTGGDCARRFSNLAPGNRSVSVGNPWTAATACPASAFRYAFAQDGENCYVISGVSGGPNTTNVWRYNATTNIWTKRAKYPNGLARTCWCFFKRQDLCCYRRWHCQRVLHL